MAARDIQNYKLTKTKIQPLLLRVISKDFLLKLFELDVCVVLKMTSKL